MKKSFSFSVRYQVARHSAFKGAWYISFLLKTTKSWPSFCMCLHGTTKCRGLLTWSWNKFWIFTPPIYSNDTLLILKGWVTGDNDKRNKVSNFLTCRPCAPACLMTHSSIQKNNVLMHCYIEVHWVLFIVFTRTLSTCMFRKALSSIPFTGFCCKKRYVFWKTFLIIVYRVFTKINLTQKKNSTGF